MLRSPAARRYARALFELAREQQRLDHVMLDLAQIRLMTQRPLDYADLFGHHLLPDATRVKLWKSILEPEADPLTVRFVAFLIQKDRAEILGEIIEEFDAMYHEAIGLLPVTITSAETLSDRQVKAIRDRFQKKLGKNIQAFLRVNPELLGGFQVRVGDTIYDYSVNHQLELLHQKLITA